MVPGTGWVSLHGSTPGTRRGTNYGLLGAAPYLVLFSARICSARDAASSRAFLTSVDLPDITELTPSSSGPGANVSTMPGTGGGKTASSTEGAIEACGSI